MNTLAAVLPSLASPVVPFSRGAKAARDFEAQLIGSVLASTEKTFAALPGDNTLPGDDDYNYLGTEALASALSASGGFGIATLITHYLDQHESKG